MLSNAPVVPYIPVRDITRARKSYEEKVGLKPKQEYAGGVIYECGKGSWALGSRPSTASQPVAARRRREQCDG